MKFAKKICSGPNSDGKVMKRPNLKFSRKNMGIITTRTNLDCSLSRARRATTVIALKEVGVSGLLI